MLTITLVIQRIRRQMPKKASAIEPLARNNRRSGSNVSTTSERLFLDYCRARGYRAARIPTPINTGRFPDFKVATTAGRLIVEIKEFTPNDEDRAFSFEFETEGRAGFSRAIGERVRKAIVDEAPQLRRFKDTPFPEVLLLYDNTGGSSSRIANYLDPLDVSSGMFGKPVIRFWRDPAHKPVGASDATHGGGRQLTETSRVYISALGVMTSRKGRVIQIDFYHNPFTTKPLWPRYFVDPADRHYVKSAHPDHCAWEWDEFIGERGST